MNTINRGQIIFLIFKSQKDKLYTGVCLDFGIVLQDKSLDNLECELKEASIGYLEAVKKEKLSEELLNNQAEQKYFDLYKKFLELERKRMAKTIVSKAIANSIGFFNWSCIPVNQLVSCNA